jgi:cysteinyl-tRNA synthetase
MEENNTISFIEQEIKTLAQEEAFLKKAYARDKLEDDAIKVEEHEIKKIEKVIMKLKTIFSTLKDDFMSLMEIRTLNNNFNNENKKREEIIEKIANSALEINKYYGFLSSVFNNFYNNLKDNEQNEREKLDFYRLFKLEINNISSQQTKIFKSLIGTERFESYESDKKAVFIKKLKEYHKIQ